MKGNLLGTAEHKTMSKTKAHSYMIGTVLEIVIQDTKQRWKQLIPSTKVRMQGQAKNQELQGFQNVSSCFLLLTYYIVQILTFLASRNQLHVFYMFWDFS